MFACINNLQRSTTFLTRRPKNSLSSVKKNSHLRFYFCDPLSCTNKINLEIVFEFFFDNSNNENFGLIFSLLRKQQSQLCLCIKENSKKIKTKRYGILRMYADFHFFLCCFDTTRASPTFLFNNIRTHVT